MPFATGLKRGLITGLTLGATFFVPVNKSASDGLLRENPLHVVTDHLLGKIRYLESRGRVHERNKVTDALGPDQFEAIPFLEQLHKHGPRLGYSAYAKYIKRKEIRDPQTNQLTGHAYDIENPETERRILEARKNKRLSHLLAKAYMTDNVLQVAHALPGRMRPWTETDAYLTHRFGAKGTIRILSALEKRPKAEFAAVVSKSVCTSNPLLCADRRGRALTVSQVYANLDEKLKNAPSINLD